MLPTNINRPLLTQLITTLILCLFTSISTANDFLGKWQVTKLDLPETYVGDIKYPQYFELTEHNGTVSGYYTDQFDFACPFSLSERVNDGNELLLMSCGTTQSAQSWAPLHKVKYLDGKLVGSVVTYGQVFVWHASPVEHLPVTKPSD